MPPNRPRGPDDRSRAEELSRAYADLSDEGYAARWSLTNPGNAAIVRERADVFDRLIAGWTRPTIPVIAVDVGCGSSNELPASAAASTRIGVDLLLERLQVGARSGVSDPLVCADGTALPFPSEAVDLVMLATVFSSVLDAGVRGRIAAECTRVLRPGGAILWYDMRFPNPRNPHISALSRRDVERLFPRFDITWQSLSLLPPLARRLGTLADRLYGPLTATRVLRSHLAGLLVKRT